MAKSYISVSGNTETSIYGRVNTGEEYNTRSSSTLIPKSIRICNTHATDSVTIDLKITQ